MDKIDWTLVLSIIVNVAAIITAIANIFSTTKVKNNFESAKAGYTAWMEVKNQEIKLLERKIDLVEYSSPSKLLERTEATKKTYEYLLEANEQELDAAKTKIIENESLIKDLQNHKQIDLVKIGSLEKENKNLQSLVHIQTQDLVLARKEFSGPAGSPIDIGAISDTTSASMVASEMLGRGTASFLSKSYNELVYTSSHTISVNLDIKNASPVIYAGTPPFEVKKDDSSDDENRLKNSESEK
jgi:hypothetical protein